jgi:hypothetical protein
MAAAEATVGGQAGHAWNYRKNELGYCCVSTIAIQEFDPELKLFFNITRLHT